MSLNHARPRFSQHDSFENIYQTIVDCSVHAMGILQDGRFVYVNPAFTRLTGYSRTEALSIPLQRLLRVFHPRDRRRLLEWYEMRLKGTRRGARQYFVRIYRKGDGLRWIAMSSRRIEWRGRFALLLSAWDVTDWRNAAEALLRREEQQQRVADSAPVPMAVVDRQGRFLLVNRTAVRALGYRSRSSVEGKTMWEFFPKPIADRHVSHIRRVIRTGQPLETVAPTMVRGQERWYHTRVVHFGVWENGEPTALVVPEDITQAREQVQILTIQKALATKLSTVNNLNAALEHVLQAALGLPGLDAGGVYLVQPDTGAIELACHRGLSKEFGHEVAFYGPNTTRARRVRRGRPVFRNFGYVRSVPLYVKEGLMSLAVLPVRCGEDVVASLNVGSRTLRSIPEHLRVALQTIASQISVILPRLKAQEDVRRSEHNLKTLFDTSHDLIFVADYVGRLLAVNRAFTRLIGRSRRECLGKRVQEIFPQSHAREIRKSLLAVMARGKSDCSVSLRTKYGAKVILDCHMTRGRWDRKKAVFAVCRDVSERSRMEEALYRSEKQLRCLLDASPDIALMMERDGTIVAANERAARSLGVKVKDMIGRKVFLFLPPDVAEYRRKNLNRVVRTQRPLFFVDRRAGRWFEHNVYPVVLSPREKATRVAAFVRDVTERRRIESELASIREFEKMRIGHELHDNLMQHIAGTGMFMGVLADRVAQRCPELVPDAEKVMELLREAVSKAREIVRGLSPIEASPGGLKDALQRLCRDMRMLFAVRCRLVCRNEDAIRSNSAATHIYCIAQEAVGNAARHGKATRIDIFLTVTGERGSLTVRDNGVGLMEGFVNNEGMGLRIMRYRASLLGGGLEVRNGPKGGTVVKCVFNPTVGTMSDA
ncbi:MAG: PAS domain S-box protein [Kiritimatiellae bacterium]|nr:PAS domain S-box protein [Kiritimatiellia bacterium]